MNTVDYFPENYADKSWVDTVTTNKDVNIYTKIMILTGALSTDEPIVTRQNKNGEDVSEKVKEYARGKYRQIISSQQWRNEIDAQYKQFMALAMPTGKSLKDKLELLPFGSWALAFEFSLKKPYISKDDEAFYIIDNPVRKDKVYKIPMIAPSQWKGCLRSVMTRRLNDIEAADQYIAGRIQLIKLFGDEPENTMQYLDKSRSGLVAEFKRQMKEKLGASDLNTYSRAGRMRFNPSFFDDIGLEIINPHDRVRKVGIKPIYIESAPIGARAAFEMLYIPFDLMGRDRSSVIKEATMDLSAIAAGIAELLTIYGVGAKISSGFGLAENEVRAGRFVTNGIELETGPETRQPKAPKLPQCVEAFWAKHPNEDRSFTKKVKDWSNNKKRNNEYRAVKEEYLTYIREKERYDEAVKHFEEQSKNPKNDELSFKSFTEMQAMLTGLAETITEGNHGKID